MDLVSTPTMTLEVTQGERTYKFLMPMGAPLGEAYDAAHYVLQEIVKYAKQAEEAAKRQETSSN